MKNIITEIFEGTKKVLTDPISFVTMILFSAGIFTLLVMIPVLTTPGNDFIFQLSIMTPELMIIVILLSLSNGLLLAMQVYIHRTVTKQHRQLGGKHKAATIGSLIASGFTSTIACAACYSAVLAGLGVGTTAFLVNHRIEIATVALLITFYAMYHAAKRINNNCAKCVVQLPGVKIA